MASPLVSGTPARKSFAQVAAAANRPIATKETSTAAQAATPSPKLLAKGHEPASASRQDSSQATDPEIVLQTAPAQHAADRPDGTGHITNGLETTSLDEKSQPASTMLDIGLKKDNSDTKSVASRTTLTLDEKESLQPDDSASMQAAVEEDTTSPSGSVAADSKQSSDPDAQAFRDQLRQIGLTGDRRVIMPRAQRPGGITTSEQRNGGIDFQATQTPNDGTPPQQPEVPETVRPRMTDPRMWIVPPDEKLLEALASPKDRLFVLKVEQDFIDFIKDPKEDFLQLPGTNSFYRMLSHKLADYYMLGHVVDDSMSSVRIFRTPSCRLPPPLIGSTPRTNGSTPPPAGPARKIMRRMGEHKTLDPGQAGDSNFESLASSKAPSDLGSGGENSKDDRPRSKGNLTREERENRYKEARARIFHDFDVNDESKASAAAVNEKGLSRSSSTSGVKKNRRQKKPKDDNFEARSAFDHFGRRISDHTFQSPPETPTFGQYYYDQNGQMLANGSAMQPGQGYGMNAFALQDGNAFASPGPAVPLPSMPPNQFGMGSPDGYNIMGNGYDGSQFSQTSNQDRTPKGTAPQLSNYNQGYMQQAWAPSGYLDPYAMGQYQYADFSPGYAPYYNGQMMPPVSPGGYDGFSPQQSPQTYNHAYFGNGYNNQHFNPQSQAFIPNMSGISAQPQHQPQHQPQQIGPSFPQQQNGYNNGNMYSSHGHSSRGKKQQYHSPISNLPTPASLPAKPPQPANVHQNGQRPSHQESKHSSAPRPIPTV